MFEDLGTQISIHLWQGYSVFVIGIIVGVVITNAGVKLQKLFFKNYLKKINTNSKHNKINKNQNRIL